MSKARSARGRRTLVLLASPVAVAVLVVLGLRACPAAPETEPDAPDAARTVPRRRGAPSASTGGASAPSHVGFSGGRAERPVERDPVVRRTLRGIVLDREDVAEGAVVTCGDAESPGSVRTTATTNAWGLFSLQVEIPTDLVGESGADSWRLRFEAVSADGVRRSVPQSMPLGSAADENVFLLLRLVPSVRTVVHVVDDAKRPVPGGEVLVYAFPSAQTSARDFDAGAGGFSTAVADAEGAAALDVAPCKVWIWARRPQGPWGVHVEKQVAAPRGDATPTADVGQVVVGGDSMRVDLHVVGDDGAPGAGALVRVAPDDAVQRFGGPPDVGGEAAAGGTEAPAVAGPPRTGDGAAMQIRLAHHVCDADGRVSFRVARGGAPLGIGVAAPAREPVDVVVLRDADVKPVEVVVPARPEIRVHVVGPGGARLPPSVQPQVSASPAKGGLPMRMIPPPGADPRTLVGRIPGDLARDLASEPADVLDEGSVVTVRLHPAELGEHVVNVALPGGLRWFDRVTLDAWGGVVERTVELPPGRALSLEPPIGDDGRRLPLHPGLTLAAGTRLAPAPREERLPGRWYAFPWRPTTGRDTGVVAQALWSPEDATAFDFTARTADPTRPIEARASPAPGSTVLKVPDEIVLPRRPEGEVRARLFLRGRPYEVPGIRVGAMPRHVPGEIYPRGYVQARTGPDGTVLLRLVPGTWQIAVWLGDGPSVPVETYVGDPPQAAFDVEVEYGRMR